MNYTAHIFLSGSDKELLLGNFIGDAVKGNDYLEYPERVAKGILLHRQIDSFMDGHPLVMKGKERLYPNYHKFSGVVMDMFYDYFLCKNWTEFSDVSYTEFVAISYQRLDEMMHLMPREAQLVLEHMMDHDWLGQYEKKSGIDKTLKGLSRRTRYSSNMENAIDDLVRYEQEFDREFRLYFPQVIQHCNQFIEHG